MKPWNRLVSFAAIAVLSAGTASAQTFTVDSAHSKVLFKVRHLGISTVTGQFRDFEARFDLEPNDLSTLKAEAVIDVASVDTQVDDRDDHLRSADFFDVENHPKIKFVSTKTEVVGDNAVKLHGDLTIRGITKPVVLDAVFGGAIKDPWGNHRAAFTASGEVNRKDFGVSWNQILDTGGLVVADEVEIAIELEAIRLDKPTE